MRRNQYAWWDVPVFILAILLLIPLLVHVAGIFRAVVTEIWTHGL